MKVAPSTTSMKLHPLVAMAVLVDVDRYEQRGLGEEGVLLHTYDTLASVAD